MILQEMDRKCQNVQAQEFKSCPNYTMVKSFIVMFSKLVVGTHMFDQWNAQHSIHHIVLSCGRHFDNSSKLYARRLFDIFQLDLLKKTNIIYVNLKSTNHYAGCYSSLLPLYYNLYCL